MGLEKETLSLMFPQELLSHFEIVLVQELGHVEYKEDFIEVVFEEKNILPQGIDSNQYESKGFYSKQIQDFPIRGKAVFLRIKRRVWRNKITKNTITTDYTFLAEGSKFTKELADFLKERS
jgi:hypothetical protein